MNANAGTAAENIISRKIGRRTCAGEIIDALPLDKILLNEVIGPAAVVSFQKEFAASFKKAGVEPRVFDRERIFIFPDHTVPSCSVKVSEGISLLREFSKKTGVRMYKEGDGIEHELMADMGHALPGDIIIGTDSHTCTNGGLGALAFGVGTTDAACAMATGEIYNFTVPETLNINVSGTLGKGVYAKDLALYIIGKLGAHGANRSVVEYTGECVKGLGMDGRFTLCNMSVEMSARTGFIAPDSKTCEYVSSRTGKQCTPFENARNAHEKTIEFEASEIAPQVALPHSPSNAKPASEVDMQIDKAFLGSCTNGRMEDMEVAAQILKNHKVHEDVDLVVVPASRRIIQWMEKTGLMSVFLEAGANVESSNCGACFGKHMGVLGKHNTCISTSNRNYVGRMGSPEAKVLLASPATVAASAINGRVTDPRGYLE